MKNETLNTLKYAAERAYKAAEGGAYSIALNYTSDYLKARSEAVKAGEGVRKVNRLTRSLVRLASELTDRARYLIVSDLIDDVAEELREL